MLHSLTIHNFTIAKFIEVDFSRGMTVITGETGAGKSLIFDALQLCMGGRGDSALIHPEADSLSITGSYSVDDETVKQWLIEHDVLQDNELVIRRVLNREGRSKSTINTTPMTLQKIRDLALLLIDINGQQQHMNLLKPGYYRDLIDKYGKVDAPLKAIQQHCQHYRKIVKQLQAITAESGQEEKKQLLRYQLEELQSADTQSGEWEALNQQQSLLRGADNLQAICTTTLNHLQNEDDHNTTRLLHHAITQLNSIAPDHPHLKSAVDLLSTAQIQIQEATDYIQDFENKIEHDPEKLATTEARMSQLHDLARKHQIKPEQLPAFTLELESTLNALENSEHALKQLKTEQQNTVNQYQAVAKELSQNRQSACTALQKMVQAQLKKLAMGHCKIHFDCEQQSQEAPQPYGLDQIACLISTNPGQAPHPLHKVASGGELSRVSLAIHVCIASQQKTPLLIFDEVDVGIGGTTAEIVGQLLAKLGKHNQVLCITHQPQVASCADHHIQVTKKISKNTVTPHIKILTPDDRQAELTRMIGHKTIEKVSS